MPLGAQASSPASPSRAALAGKEKTQARPPALPATRHTRVRSAESPGLQTSSSTLLPSLLPMVAGIAKSPLANLLGTPAIPAAQVRSAKTAVPALTRAL